MIELHEHDERNGRLPDKNVAVLRRFRLVDPIGFEPLDRDVHGDHGVHGGLR